MRAILVAICGVGLGGIALGQAITEFPIPTPSTQPTAITGGPDGNVWFTETTYATCPGPLGPATCPVAGGVSRIRPDGTMTEFSTSLGGPLGSPFPYGITAGPDGNLWFTTLGSVLGQISTGGVINQFNTFIDLGGKSIATGSDGNLWMTEIGDRIARITTTGVVTEFPLPTTGTLLQKIVAGSDGSLWFTELGANQIGRITTAGMVAEFPIPTARCSPLGIAAGPDGNLWFTESIADKIGRITTAGVISEYALPTVNSEPAFIAAGADGNLWFTELSGNKIGRITTAGIITEFAIPTPNALPLDIASGPDGNLWFIGSGFIGRVTTSGAACLPDSHTLCLTNGRFEVTPSFQTTPSGPSAPANAVPLTRDTGYFWFFDAANIELVTKVLNGCGVNGGFWFFASGLTNVGVDILVTDTVTGTAKNYSNAVGTAFPPIQDTAAFPCP